MPKGSSSENVHFDFRGTSTSNSTINSLGSASAGHNLNLNTITTTNTDCIGSAKNGHCNNFNDLHEYSNVQFGSSKTLIFSKFFNTSKTDDNSPAYENLCSGCGYGVFEARGELCNFCQYVLNGCPTVSAEDNTNNIYENICDKCSQLYSGDECLFCLETSNKHIKENNIDNNVKLSSKKKLKKRLIHSLLGSLKRVKSFNAATTTSSSQVVNIKSPNRKLQIVHNVDGFENVFSTNETFDLNRICELKQKQQQQHNNKIKASTSDHHIYGKLRKSDEDDHLHRTHYECIKQKSQSDDYLISGTTVSIVGRCDDPLYCSTSINSHDSLLFLDDNNTTRNNSLSYLHTIRNSVSEWMTSLRCETHDYYSFGAPDTVLSNPKSIPGNFSEFNASSFVFYPRHVESYDQMQRHTKQILAQAKSETSSFSDEISQVEFAQQMVNEFKRNLMEKPGPHSVAYKEHMKTKRQGIHLKLDVVVDDHIENKQQRAQTNYQQRVVVDENVDDDDDGDGGGVVWMVGDHQQRRRNDSNCLLQQSSAQAQVVALAAGLNGNRRKPEHQLNKRCCIYEKDSDFVSDILQVFDSILLRESDNNNISPPSPSPSSSSSSSSLSTFVEFRNCENSQVVNEVLLDILPQSSTSDSKSYQVISTLPQNLNLNLDQIAFDLLLSKSLNKIVINYEIPLKLFLSGVDKSSHLCHLSYPKLKKIFQRFQVFLSKNHQKNVQLVCVKKKVSSDCCMEARSLEINKQELLAIEYKSHSSSFEEKKFEVPHPKLPAGVDSIETMTVPNGTLNTKADHDEDEKEEEPIYQPIWKFKTLGEVAEETDITDVYYDGDHHLPRRCDSSSSLVGVAADIEDHDEWEPDDEFTFTTKLDMRACGGNRDADTISVNTIQSSSGSTITGYASSISTMTLASTTSSTGVGDGSGCIPSVTHHILRNICIFYSLKDPKIRAVLYEYDRNRCSSYFAQQMPPQPPPLPASLLSLSSSSSSSLLSIKKTGRGGANGSTPPTTSAADYYDTTTRRSPCFDGNKFAKKSSSESGSPILPDSVQAWKYLLLDVNYLEDEEDMIVSESQILKAQTVQEMDSTPPRVGVLQRFKSISSSSLLDMPAEEDKKSITERVRNKLQRGVFKLHPRSPKEGKKSRNLFRRNEATSLYLEDGMKPKYPIFKAPLEFLEMNETSYPDVPRFVVDCIEYIEQKDCIQVDGLYRASGNKVAIDELKQKLTESYIYDPKLLVTDDIHTLTSLLKMFFRELGSPLIPHNTYKSFAPTKNLMEPSAIEDMKIALQTMKNPNRETLKFLIKHLTTVAHYSSENRMPASNLAIVWGPCILAVNQIEFDIARMNTIAKVLIENYDQIFGDNERLVS
ncbi:uncharacterized protein LOC129908349 [Episyrphus balteatus]|uniref:uncharacterized protein LOC129908349 n=1 Tax=Episyrphus balteatus TaxID=286459 RepID=UPI002485DAA0|nr:uncharacterized protein LOC129908349 [Episyrphus balteatus]